MRSSSSVTTLSLASSSLPIISPFIEIIDSSSEFKKSTLTESSSNTFKSITLLELLNTPLLCSHPSYLKSPLKHIIFGLDSKCTLYQCTNDINLYKQGHFQSGSIHVKFTENDEALLSIRLVSSWFVGEIQILLEEIKQIIYDEKNRSICFFGVQISKVLPENSRIQNTPGVFCSSEKDENQFIILRLAHLDNLQGFFLLLEELNFKKSIEFNSASFNPTFTETQLKDKVFTKTSTSINDLIREDIALFTNNDLDWLDLTKEQLVEYTCDWEEFYHASPSIQLNLVDCLQVEVLSRQKSIEDARKYSVSTMLVMEGT